MESPESSRKTVKSALKNSQDLDTKEEVTTSAREKKVQELIQVQVHAHDVDSQSEQENTQDSTDPEGEGQDYPDQGQGNVEKHVHVTKSVAFMDESGNVESTRTEITKTFSTSMSETKVQADEDFFD